MNVGVAKKTDYDEIINLIKTSLDTYVSKFLEPNQIFALKKFYDAEKLEKMTEIFIAKKEKIVGCFAIQDIEEAKMLYVVPNFTGYRAAVLLFEKAKDYARENNLEHLEFEALESSVNFLSKMGAQITNKKNVKILNCDFQIYNMSLSID